MVTAIIIYLDEDHGSPHSIASATISLEDGKLEAASAVDLTPANRETLARALDAVIDQQTREYATTEAFELALRQAAGP